MEYHFVSEEKQSWLGPVSREDLDRAKASGKITDATQIYWQGLPGELAVHFRDIECEYFVRQGDPIVGEVLVGFSSRGDLIKAVTDGTIPAQAEAYPHEENARPLPLRVFAEPALSFDPGSWQFHRDRLTSPITVLTGPNNCGKSYLLKTLHSIHGPSAQLILPARFNAGATPGHSELRRQELNQFFTSFLQQYSSGNNNFDTMNNKLDHSFQHLSDERQDDLLQIVGDQIGIDFKHEQVGGSRRPTKWKLLADGKPLSAMSSGTRLLLSLLAACMVPQYDTLLIDEPELGLSPRMQNVLASMFYSADTRSKLFPHVIRFFLSTHSHIFIDRAELANNFVLHRDGDNVRLEQMSSIAALHNLQLNMLGNDLRTLYLPQAIVFVEGPSDQEYLSHVVSQRFPNSQIGVVNCCGDGGIARKLHVLSEAFCGLDKSPYAGRVLCVLDQKHSALFSSIERQGVRREHIVVWEGNGVEYVYPDSALSAVFGSSDRAVMDIDDLHVELNEIRKTKRELATEIVKSIRADTQFPQELTDKLLRPLARILES